MIVKPEVLECGLEIVSVRGGWYVAQGHNVEAAHPLFSPLVSDEIVRNQTSQ